MSVSVEVADGVAVVRLDREPPTRLRALLPTLTDVCALVLHACSGGVSAASVRGVVGVSPSARREHVRELRALRSELARLPVPVVAAIGGSASGDLAVLADACDRRVLAEGGDLVRVTGTGVVVARRVDAAEALRTGLVDRVVAPAHVLPAAVELARECKSAQDSRKSCRIVAP
ncbi:MULTISPECIES: enoyl-CoA hydratase/isomerase family protein [unclassified Saccharothrix]|uniref:enoyl-CoA hydratase/isomerase family protein n=1 Tax=unclassified Saccharothrix TaxID=2593673 RepID=UPI00307D4A4F